MFPEFGHFALVLACVIAGISSLLLAVGACRNNPIYLSFGVTSVAIQTTLITFACATLFYAFYTVDLSVQYVALHTHQSTPWYYRITAFWGAHEGSLLLWAWLLNLWTFFYTIKSKRNPWRVQSTELAILLALSAALLAFILGSSNPFLRFLPLSPTAGKDLNPLLQDPGLASHPPILYLGYVGFAICYAQAVAALLLKKVDNNLFKRMRSWILGPFALLTTGIVLGSFWAYYELGWGGFWFWDPVENASFMPWLVSVALIHCLILNISKGKYKNLSIVLAILIFAMSILGTFLVRSGAIVSVHAFASDPERGLFILLYFIFFIGGAYSLFAVRSNYLHESTNQMNTVQHKIKNGKIAEVFPIKEKLLLLHVAVTLVTFFTVILGTLYPMLLDSLNIAKISVGPPYFNQILLPQVCILLFILPFAILTKYNSEFSFKPVINALFSIFAIALILYLFLTKAEVKYIILFALLTWVSIAYIKICFKPKFRYKQYIPMHLAHIGLLCALLGVSLTSYLSIEKDLKLGLNDTVKIGSYTFTLSGMREINGTNYTAFRANILVSPKIKYLQSIKQHMYPEKRLYTVTKMPITETAIATNIAQDIYIALGEPLPDNTWSVRIYIKPFVRLIWIGGLIIALGSMLSLLQASKSSDKNI